MRSRDNGTSVRSRARQTNLLPRMLGKEERSKIRQIKRKAPERGLFVLFIPHLSESQLREYKKMRPHVFVDTDKKFSIIDL